MDTPKHSRRRIMALGSLFFFVSACKNKSIVGTSDRLPGKSEDQNRSGGDEVPVQLQTPFPPQDVPQHKTPAKIDLVGLKVTIDVGHAPNGSDGSASHKGVNEHVQVKKQSAIIAEKLKARGASVNVKIYEFYELSKVGNRGKAGVGSTVLVSLHHNAFSSSVQGTETLIDVRRGKTEADKKFAKFIHDAIISALWKGQFQQHGGNLNRGVKTQPLALLKNTPQSVEACCLTEPYFITGKGCPENAEGWTSASAHAIADGIAQWWKSKSGNMNLYSLTDPYTSFELAPSDPMDFTETTKGACPLFRARVRTSGSSRGLSPGKCTSSLR